MRRRINVTGRERMKNLWLTAESIEEERKLAQFYIELRRTGKATLEDPSLISPAFRKHLPKN